MGTGFQNQYDEYDITPFVLPAGTYVFSVYHKFTGVFFYTESASNISSDWIAHHTFPVEIGNYVDEAGYSTLANSNAKHDS